MWRLLLVTILLSTVMSEDGTEKRQEAFSRAFGVQFLPKRGKRLPRDIVPFDSDDFSGSRVFSKPVKLSPLTVVRHHSDTGHANSHYPLDECRNVNPTILVSVDFHDLLEKDDQFAQKCTSERCQRRSEGWELQKPFYVDEPNWIEIENDYADGSPRNVGATDPFVLSRGKKVLAFKNPGNSQENSAFDYNDFLDSREKIGKPSVRVFPRSRRSSSSHRTAGDGKENDMKKKDVEGKPSKPIERSYIDNLSRFEDPFFITRGKKAKDKRRSKDQPEDYDDDRDRSTVFVMGKAKRSKRSLPAFDGQNDGDQPKDQRMKSQDVCHRSKSGKEILPQLTSETAKGQVDNLTASKRASNYYSENANENRQNLWSVNSRVRRDNFDSSFSVENDDAEGKLTQEYSQRYKKTQKISTNHLQSRDKHSDILDILNQPFFISRGKKAGAEKRDLFLDDGESASENFLRSLVVGDILNKLTERLQCTSEECVNDFGRMAKRKLPRDRRRTLDDLLSKYDPFYVARGKRTILDRPAVNVSLMRNAKTESDAPFRVRSIQSDLKNEMS